MSSVTLSINAAIQVLRAEIIAPTWEISPQRLVQLRAALSDLNVFFATRPHALALLKMATSVVVHIEQQDSQAKAVDFLKEAMAHIVSLYEDDEYDPEREKETASRAYKRFLRLNINFSKESLQAPSPARNTTHLLDTLADVAIETANLPVLLMQAGTLSPADQKRVASLLGKISTAINIVWARLPPAP